MIQISYREIENSIFLIQTLDLFRILKIIGVQNQLPRNVLGHTVSSVWEPELGARPFLEGAGAVRNNIGSRARAVKSI